MNAALDNNPLIDFSRLNELALKSSADYIEAFPYAHGAYDAVFEEKILNAVLGEFVALDNEDQSNWREFDAKYEKKKQMSNDLGLGNVTRRLIHELNSAPFLEFLSTLTGIQGLIPDPYLVGGGLHKIPKGGKLGVHVDFNQHKQMKVYRRINVIVYLNKDWKEEYGGHFELWREKEGGCEKKILPIFNRMAIFNTTNTSFHGHPEPLNCPQDRFRRSLALYYYTSENGGEQARSKHSTIFLDDSGKRVSEPSTLSSKVKKLLKLQ